MSRLGRLATIVVVIPLSLAATLPTAVAATTGQAQNQALPQRDDLRDYLVGRAVLYQLRVAFDVIQPDAVPELLAKDAIAARAHGVSMDMRSADRDDLLAEGSYYIVSLRYLADVDGANWPTDRPEAAYRQDALSQLAKLQQQWLDAVRQGGDLVGIMDRVDLINAWTQGETSLTPQLAHFAEVDKLVDDILAGRYHAPSAHSLSI